MTEQTVNGGNGSKVNTWFWVIGILALLWNLAGLSAFLGNAFQWEAMTEGMSEAQIEEFKNTPMWLLIVFGIATVGGTLGCILLLMKKKLAITVFLVSFVAIVIQFVGGVIGSVAVTESGPTALIFPICVIIIGALLWYYAKKCDEKGWLS